MILSHPNFVRVRLNPCSNIVKNNGKRSRDLDVNK